jgi:hypothetical protein
MDGLVYFLVDYMELRGKFSRGPRTPNGAVIRGDTGGGRRKLLDHLQEGRRPSLATK